MRSLSPRAAGAKVGRFGIDVPERANTGPTTSVLGLRRQAPWILLLAILVTGFMTQACTMFKASGDSVPAYQMLRTPDGYGKWYQRFLALNWDMLAAQAKYEREKSPDALRVYELAVQKCLDHSAALYWAYQYDNHPTAPNKDIAATIEVISPYLNTMANRMMNVAEEYVKQGYTAAGTAIAAHLVTHYPDIALRSVRERAEGLLVQHRYQRDW